MGPTASAHCPGNHQQNEKRATDAAAQAPVELQLGLLVGAGLQNISSPYLSDPVPHVDLQSVLGTRALEWC